MHTPGHQHPLAGIFLNMLCPPIPAHPVQNHMNAEEATLESFSATALKNTEEWPHTDAPEGISPLYSQVWKI